MPQKRQDKFGRKKEAAIAALLAAPTIADAARIAGIGEATMYRWMKETDFRERLHRAKEQTVGQTVTRLQKTAGEAVEILRTLMNDGNCPAHARTMAAKSIVSLAVRSIYFEELALRVEVLEDVARKQTGRDDRW